MFGFTRAAQALTNKHLQTQIDVLQSDIEKLQEIVKELTNQCENCVSIDSFGPEVKNAVDKAMANFDQTTEIENAISNGRLQISFD